MAQRRYRARSPVRPRFAPAPPALLRPAWVVGRIHVSDRERPLAGHLDECRLHGIDPLVHACVHRDMRLGIGELPRGRFVELVAHAVVKSARADANHFVGWMVMRRNSVVRRHFDLHLECTFLAWVTGQDRKFCSCGKTDRWAIHPFERLSLASRSKEKKWNGK